MTIPPLSGEERAELRKLAEAATQYVVKYGEPQNEMHVCPLCDGDGEVPALVQDEDDPQHVVGIQYYGVGNAHRDLQRYVDAANPSTVLSLLDEIEGLGKRVEEAEQKADARLGAANQMAVEFKAAEQRAAELEAQMGRVAAWISGPRTAEADAAFFAAMNDLSAAVLAERKRVKGLEANQRTPGACEYCALCDRDVGDGIIPPKNCDADFADPCPIRQPKAQTTSAGQGEGNENR